VVKAGDGGRREQRHPGEMEEPEIKRAAGFLVERRGTADAK
jgi:hypothetical protein